MRRLMVMALATLPLAGCNSGPATPDEMASIQAQCDGYGFRRGSDAFAACVLQLDQNRIASAVERRRAVGQALREASADMERQRQRQRQISCTSSTFGRTTTTNCY